MSSNQTFPEIGVLVMGGGISGAIAAIAAARTGARTLLVEQYGFLGGMLTASGVGPMMTFHAGDRQVVQGITGELIERLKTKGLSPGHIFDTTGYTYTVTPFDLEGMKVELETMLLEANGQLLYHTMLAGVTVDQGRITGLTLCNKAGLSSVSARMYVDATGDADLSAWAGVGFSLGRPDDGLSQPMTMKLRFGDVDVSAIRRFIKEHPEEFPRLKGDTSIIDKSPRLSIGGFVKLFEQARIEGKINFPRDELLLFEANTPGEVIVNTTRLQGFDSTDPYSLSRAEVEGRKQAQELSRFILSRVPGFKNARLLFTGPFIGVRSSRQVQGCYTLTADDLLESRDFPDVIALGGYPIDIHNPTDEGGTSRFMPFGAVYQIPYRCLVNPVIDNLVTVGRSVSADFEAQAAIRVTPIAGAIGHAGGVAAALSVVRDCPARDVPASEIQAYLKEQGACLPDLSGFCGSGE